MSGTNDEELRQHFRALREVELARVRSFAELSRRPATLGRTRPTRGARWVLAGGLGAMAAAALLHVHMQRRHEATWRSAAAAISSWTPPSDALLEVSDRALVGGPATLGASVLDALMPPSREY